MEEEGVKFDSQGNVLSSGLNTTPGDPGGTTNFGFAQRYNPDIDVTQLTLDTAKARAKAKYWDIVPCDAHPWPSNIILFDTCFNQSLGEARSLLTTSRTWEDMLWARLTQYSLKRPANAEFTRWWLVRVIHLHNYILTVQHA